MYETQDPFKLFDFAAISMFLNQFIYKSVYTLLFGTYFKFNTLIYQYSKNSLKKFCIVSTRRITRRYILIIIILIITGTEKKMGGTFN